MPTETELAYCAGVIDSDGCIGVRRRRYAGNGQWYYFASVRVGQVTPEAVDLLARTFGKGVYVERMHGRRRDLYRWDVSSRRAIECLQLVIPYLRIKRAQAENCLLLDATRKQSPLQRQGGTAKWSTLISAETSSAMQLLYERSKVLNQVGIPTQ